MAKVTDMSVAISSALRDGQTVYFGGFTHLIPFAAGHEIIRQGITDLNLVRATPDLIYDQMIAAGCTSKITFSWAGNPGVGSLPAFRRAIEDSVPTDIEFEEYSHYGMIARLAAGAQDIPFLPVRSLVGSDIPKHSENIQLVENPFSDDDVYVVSPLKPNVAVIRAQRADDDGNAHVWGIQGDIVEAAFAADTVILSVEELVEAEVIRSDPNRTIVPGSVVDYVVEEPYGSHPSYAQGYYNRDNELYVEWSEIASSHESTVEWLNEWVYDITDRDEYLDKLGMNHVRSLKPELNYGAQVNMGRYT